LISQINESVEGIDKNNSFIIKIEELKLVGDSMKVVKTYFEN